MAVHWIPDQPRYKEGAQLYCDWCGEITSVEANPAWVADGRPLRWDDHRSYEWVIRCASCKRRIFQSSGFECDNCGAWPAEDDSDVLERTKPSYNRAIAMEYGGQPLDWDEKRRCRICGTEFWMHNANY